MPAITRYESNGCLLEPLAEISYFITNRDLAEEYVLGQLQRIYSDWKEGKNPYVCQARYRQWIEEWFVDSPFYYMLCDPPTWEEVTDELWWRDLQFFGFQEDGEYEWAIFSDAAGLQAAHRETQRLGLGCDAIELLQRISLYDVEFLAFEDHSDALYVLRSSIRGHFQAFQGGLFTECVDGGVSGLTEGYALDPFVLEEAERIKRELDEPSSRFAAQGELWEVQNR